MKADRRAAYEATAQMVFEVVRAWQGKPLRFFFPPREVAVLAGVDQVAEAICDGEGAVDLVRELVDRVAPLEPPTAMMLRVVLELLHVPITWLGVAAWGERMGARSWGLL